jgi:2-oxoglutarate ferredoxin oxidoreductase subunit gamma
MRTEIKLGGFGGQGIILGGYIVGKAASLFSDKHASMIQSYGPEARGGACSSEVVVEDQQVSYPAVVKPDVLVLMSQEAYEKFKPMIDAGTQVLIDEDLVELDEGQIGRIVAIPSLKFAEELGRKIVANIIMLGFFTSVTELFTKEAMKEAVLTTVPEHTKELNEKAFERGYEYGLELEKGRNAE